MILVIDNINLSTMAVVVLYEEAGGDGCPLN